MTILDNNEPDKAQEPEKQKAIKYTAQIILPIGVTIQEAISGVMMGEKDKVARMVGFTIWKVGYHPEHAGFIWKIEMLVAEE